MPAYGRTVPLLWASCLWKNRKNLSRGIDHANTERSKCALHYEYEKNCAGTVQKTEERRENSQTVGGTTVEAPMQGLVLSVLVSQGEKVKAGQELVIIEAMKMENPIVAPIDGTVESVNVSKGDIVETGNPIVTLI